MVDQLQQQFVPIDRLPAAADHHFQSSRGEPSSVNARHAGHDNHIPPTDQRRRRASRSAVDVIVDGRILLDVNVACGMYAPAGSSRNS